MTIDERLEALTQTVELMAAMQRDNEARWEERWAGWEERWAGWEERWAKISQAIAQDAENIRALARIAEIHERRLTDLEGDQ